VIGVNGHETVKAVLADAPSEGGTGTEQVKATAGRMVQKRKGENNPGHKPAALQLLGCGLSILWWS
jgi:hypothetical protein